MARSRRARYNRGMLVSTLIAAVLLAVRFQGGYTTERVPEDAKVPEPARE